MVNQFEVQKNIEQYLVEDGLDRHQQYWQQLPLHEVNCQLKIKSDCLISGLPYFLKVFQILANDHERSFPELMTYEGKWLVSGTVLNFKLPLGVALSGERVALNLLSHASAIATYTHQLVKKASAKNIVILDTRKTTPGLRWLEKYAVVCGGGKNHRWSQTDMWMIKDNHKTLMGGVKGALEYFQNMGAYYNPILLEVHSLEELRQGLELGIRHFMLDNFSSNDIAKAVAIKKAQTTFEISGGVTLENIDQYLIAGIDAISVGSLTQNPPRIDLSLKMESRA